MRSLLFLWAASVFLAAVFTPDAKDEADAAQAESVRIVKNVPYLDPERKEKMDFYFPGKMEAGMSYPAVLIIHGGGWRSGDKAATREINIGTNLAKAGFICASINYQLAKEQPDFVQTLKSVWPNNLHDCKNAVRYLRKYADKYQIDPEHIGVIGGSAGGHLTAMVGLPSQDVGLEPKGPYAGVSSKVQAIVPLYGVHDLVTRAKQKNIWKDLNAEEKKLCKTASPITYADKTNPPVLIMHGTADTIVPVEQSELLADALESAGANHRLVIVKGAPHTFHLQPKGHDLGPTVIQFFNKHLKGK